MVDNQHRLIKGQNDLSLEQIGNMNSVKELGEQLKAMIDELSTNENVDLRWLAIARTDLQKGIMCLIRSIAKPNSF